MDLTSVETRPQEPQKEKQLAWLGMTVGLIVGAALGALVFFTPSLFTSFPYQRMLVIVGAIAGAVQGAYLGPLVTLRLSQWFGQRSSLAR
jgi:hypothetical protein